MSQSGLKKTSRKAAQRGEPSYVWRAGQERRLKMIEEWSGDGIRGYVLENGCGVGEYLNRIQKRARFTVGLDLEFPRLQEAGKKNQHLVCAAGENLPFKTGTFSLVLSNEVIEHMENDKKAVSESVRVLAEAGRFLLFCPNRGYPFETHGIFCKGEYRFGNKPLVNYLPDRWRKKLAPHVRAYTKTNLGRLFEGMRVSFVFRTIIYGAYDNLIQKWPEFGKTLRSLLHFFEKTPLRVFGLSHFWVIEKD